VYAGVIAAAEPPTSSSSSALKGGGEIDSGAPLTESSTSAK